MMKPTLLFLIGICISILGLGLQTEMVMAQTTPVVPASVAAFALNTQTVQVQWRDLSTNENGFGLRRSKNGAAWQVVTTNIAPNTTFYNDANLDPNGHYCYAVFAHNNSGNSEFSNAACAITQNPNLNAPILTAATLIQTTSIFLTWTLGGSGGITFNVQSRPIAGGWTTLQTGVTGTNWTHTNIPEITNLCYRVEHVVNETPYYSNEICANTGAFPPQNISNLQLNPVTNTEHQSLVASWESTTQSGVSYEVQTREVNGAWSAGVEQTAATYTLSNLSAVTTYEVRVRAKRTVGTQVLYSAWSSPIRATTWLGIWSGDTNGDGRVNLADITFLTQTLFYGNTTPFRDNPQNSLGWNLFITNPLTYNVDLLRADANRDGKVDIFDIFPIVANYNRVAFSQLSAIQARITSPQQAEILHSILANLPNDAQNGQGNLNASALVRQDLEMLLQQYTNELPTSANLYQNYPNPFQNETIVSFDIAQKQDVTLNLYNVLGQKVKTILHESLVAGRYQQVVEARDLSNGMYILEMQTDTQRFTKMLTIQK